jgi:hypothetical protein
MHGFSGTWALVCLALRRERKIAPIWIALIVLIVVGMGANYARVFPTEESCARVLPRKWRAIAYCWRSPDRSWPPIWAL